MEYRRTLERRKAVLQQQELELSAHSARLASELERVKLRLLLTQGALSALAEAEEWLNGDVHGRNDGTESGGES